MKLNRVGLFSIFLLLSGLFLYLGWTSAAYTNDASWKELFSTSAQSNTFLHSMESRYEQNYHPNYILDNNPATAWVEGLDGDGEGAEIEWKVSAISSTEKLKLEIKNGYQKSQALLQKNGAPARVLVTVLDSENDKTMEQEFQLRKVMGWQPIVLSPGFLSHGGVATVRLKIISVHPGTVYKDTCISDIKTYVISKVPYNKSLEESKRKRLIAWAHERKRIARAGGRKDKNLAVNFDDFEYDTKPVASFPGEYRQAIQKHMADMSQLGSQKGYFKIVTNLPTKNYRDFSGGVFFLYRWALQQSSFSIFESNAPVDFNYSLAMETLQLSNIHRSLNPQTGELAAFTASYIDTTDERGTYIVRGQVYINYLPGGKIDSFLNVRKERTDYDAMERSGMIQDNGYTFIKFVYDSSGHLSAFHQFSRSIDYQKKISEDYTVARAK